jgi:hypothetical protein
MSAEAMHPSAQTEAEPEEVNEEFEYVTIPERCDQCGSQSYYKIVLKNDGELFLCYHHYNSHEEKLFEVAEDIIDESELLHKS